MKNTLLLVLVLLASSCASMAPESSQNRAALPSAVTEPSPASTEGVLGKSLQDGAIGLQDALQRFYEDTLEDLRQSLERARVSPPTTGRAAPGL